MFKVLSERHWPVCVFKGPEYLDLLILAVANVLLGG